jgi:cytochrome c-type biogenesis protein CcmH/NrfG
MQRSLVTPPVVVLALGAAIALSPAAWAQTKVTAGIRGKVVDENGEPLPAVKIDFEFTGESRQKITKSQLTDKKGGFVRVGIPGGPWKMSFTKEGYQSFFMDTYLSDGGFSEIPNVVMKTGTAAAAAAPPPSAAEVAPVMPPESASMKDVYNKAVEATRAGNLEEAEKLYQEILDRLPNLAEIHYNLGRVYVAKKDLDSAEASFRKVVELQPEKPDGLIALAALLGANGKTQEAADLLIQAGPTFEGNAMFQFVLGTTCMNAGRSQPAAAAFRKVIALDPANAGPHFYLGTLAVGENKVADAIAELDKFVAGTGQNPQDLATAKKLLEVLKKR